MRSPPFYGALVQEINLGWHEDKVLNNIESLRKRILYQLIEWSKSQLGGGETVKPLQHSQISFFSKEQVSILDTYASNGVQPERNNCFAFKYLFL